MFYTNQVGIAREVEIAGLDLYSNIRIDIWIDVMDKYITSIVNF